ncbi:hypothetical protein LX69_02487 [Breznakibacter xylanolyticus]|uniref:Uncharacterized protein n=1 Tax=Breznakibacter xylanolyticus TaxID=990 RepID=A0A2W7PW37_9BACT|nr:hypothetical protein [Breznakibacter xylanolyticus]MBN2743020.1 hypothetical protein [Marinilabiliaceae bacterium]PZX13809.1 hypothetical protein LX69_02487 [Breznakibacter xylanolyticus]
MKTIGEEIKEWQEYLTSYANAEAELFKLRLIDRMTVLFSALITKVVILAFVLVSALLASVALAFWLGDTLKSLPLGFVIVSGAYLVLLVLFVILRQPLVEKPVLSLLLELFFSKPHHDNEA